jgi:hypothetical protein
MYTKEDLRKDGYSQNNDGTWSPQNSNQKLLVETGDTGQIYTKVVGGPQDGYNRHDPSSTPNNTDNR